MIKYPQINPVAIDIGFIKIHWYGISYVAGLLIAWWLLARRARTTYHDWSSEQVADLIFYATLGILLGGRLGSVLFYNLPYYLQHPLAIFKIWEGGMSFHGGFIGVLIAVWLFGRSTGKGFFSIVDFYAPVVPIGLAFGRIANFINGELWGKPANLPWAMIFPDPHAGGIPRHPSQLYEALLEGLVLFIIMWWFSAKPKPVMATGGLATMLYGIFRASIEFVREPDANIGYLAWGWLTMGQVLSLPMILIGALMLWAAYRQELHHK